VARAVLEITTRPATRERVTTLTNTFADGLADLADRHPGWLVEVRQSGLVIGLRFAHPMGGLLMVQACHRAGLWAMVASFDRSVLQFKPGLLMSDAEAAEALARLDAASSGLLASGMVEIPQPGAGPDGNGAAPAAANGAAADGDPAGGHPAGGDPR
jgi:acetylornithine/succinyldiaminopimelate/putrescine aminotransferase